MIYLLPNTLPAGLQYLACRGNRIERLPEALPATLTVLICDYNGLSSLPELPSTLTYLSCSHNHTLACQGILESMPDYVARMINSTQLNAMYHSRVRIVRRCTMIFEELAQKVWHPSRVERLMLAGVDMEDM